MFKRKQLRCSFCGKKEAEVSKLVAGPKVYICDACVVLARQIMENHSGDHTQPPKTDLPVWRKVLIRARQLWRGGETRRISSPVVSS